MNRSFYNGISGVKTQQFGIDIWGNNIANTSLNGYKSVNPEFKTLFSTALSDQNIGSISNDIGTGSTIQGTALNLKQGVLQITDSTFDLALDGEGWFGIKAPHNENLFTRAGSFQIDKDGNLINEAGMFLYGTSGNNITPFSGPQTILDDFGKVYKDGTRTQAKLYTVKDIGDISLGAPDKQTKIFLPSNLYYPATPTKNIKIKANFDPQTHLDSSGNVIPNVEHFTASVITSTGEKKLIDINFTKNINTPNNENSWSGEIKLLSFYENFDKNKTYDPTQYKIYGGSNKVYKIESNQTAQIKFSPEGFLESGNIPSVNNNGTPIKIDIGKVGTYEGFESINTSTGIKNIETDGFQDGMLSKYEVDKRGVILANFDNGRTTPVAKIGVYHFQNDMGLSNVSGVLFKESSNSGKAFFYKDKQGNDLDTTKIYSQRLEASNVDSTTALTELIMTQKAFEASAKSITTSDQMIQKAINMKR